MRPRAPTVRDVARLAGVSSATVSRALERPEMVGAATRARVLAAVEEAGYVPNAQARKLRRRAAEAVILLVSDIANPFYLDIFKGVSAEAQAAGLGLLMGDAAEDLGRIRHHVRMVKERHADGLILMTGQLPPAAERDGVPLVAALSYFPGEKLPTVRIDNQGAARRAVEHLLALGHRRIAHVGGLPEAYTDARAEGWRRALGEAGLPAPQGLEIRAPYSLDGGHRAAEALLARGPRPTAIFCAADTLALGVVRALRARGLEVPRDVSVVGFDDLPLASGGHPPLTTVRQPTFEIGATAMRLLAGLLRGEPPPARAVVLPTELVVRGSTAPPRPAHP